MWLVSKLNKGCLLQYHSQSESCGRYLLWPQLQLINCQGHWGLVPILYLLGSILGIGDYRLSWSTHHSHAAD